MNQIRKEKLDIFLEKTGIKLFDWQRKELEQILDNTNAVEFIFMVPNSGYSLLSNLGSIAKTFLTAEEYIK